MIVDHHGVVDVWQGQIDINLNAALWMFAVVVAHMKSVDCRRTGRITSIAAQTSIADSAALCAARPGGLQLWLYHLRAHDPRERRGRTDRCINAKIADTGQPRKGAG
ncbi:hypothetical protein GG681_13250 [Epibacterium sp. SM1969]|uniref:Uncharacterized protein n=1 Tax=Tritonibacter aquimaris TaxID=2663379 RepID=A0A844AUU6_9RHOB|nr:hypothetical protein [Tritonibacter aquimaris]MQY43607.1 hypothetical protein [Tritonibacter aquimaris]